MNTLFLWILGCHPGQIELNPDSGDSGDSEIEVTPLAFEPQLTGGFDDWGSPGAAFGYASDPDRWLTLVAAMSFELPVYEQSFTPHKDPSETLWGYPVLQPPEVMADDVEALPILSAATTNTEGIRSMKSDFTAILLEGDPADPSPDRIYVAYSGDAALTRLDDPEDELTLELVFVEYGSMGSLEPSDGAAHVKIGPVTFSWPTSEQP